ncbi:MAG: hypothetical protein WA604_02680 [Candidatus Sulfotelmatobacter sp.]
MSVASVASSPITGFSVNSSSNSNKLSQLREQFQQLGQDLQAGNLSGAQSDFASLQQEASLGSGSTTAPANDPVTQALKQLQTDLQTGDLAGTTPKPVGSVPIAIEDPRTHGGRGHNPFGPEGPEDPTTPGSNTSLEQLGQALQSNNLSAAQQAYNSVLQGLPLSLSNGMLSTPDVMSQSGGGVSLSI